jgi:hypothetical protein
MRKIIAVVIGLIIGVQLYSQTIIRGKLRIIKETNTRGKCIDQGQL